MEIFSKTVIVLILWAVFMLINGWVLEVIWGWFMVPIFNLPAITIVEAMGLSLVVSFTFFFNNILDIMKAKASDVKKSNDSEFLDRVILDIVFIILYSVLTLGIGYLIHLMM